MYIAYDDNNFGTEIKNVFPRTNFGFNILVSFWTAHHLDVYERRPPPHRCTRMTRVLYKRANKIDGNSHSNTENVVLGRATSVIIILSLRVRWPRFNYICRARLNVCRRARRRLAPATRAETRTVFFSPPSAASSSILRTRN